MFNDSCSTLQNQRRLRCGAIQLLASSERRVAAAQKARCIDRQRLPNPAHPKK
jgi:hypothetical protein